jgi:hypothetical protein
MMDEIGGIGESAAPLKVSVEEEPQLQEAVRESVHRQIVVLLERRGVTKSPDLLRCPICGDRVILLDLPSTFVLHEGDRICAPCGAERDLINVVHPEADIGGEGGAG